MQVRFTVPLKPEFVTIEILAEDVPPGATASGLSVGALKVKSCAMAAGTAAKITNRQTAGIPAHLVHIVNLDANLSDLNMNRFGSNSFDSWDC